MKLNLKNPYTLCSRFSFLYTLYTVLFLTYLAVPVFAEISSEEAKKRAVDFLPRRGVALTITETVGSNDNANPVSQHRFQSVPAEGIVLDIDKKTGQILYYRWNRLKLESQQILFSQGQAQEIAEKLIAHAFTKSQDAQIHLNKARLINRGDAGITYGFEWGKKVRGIKYPFQLSIEISAQTGEVTNYYVIDHPLTIRTLVPKMTKGEALKLAAPYVKFKEGWEVTEVGLGISAPNPVQRLQWRIQVKGIFTTPYNPDSGQFVIEQYMYIIINDDTGTLALSYTSKVDESKQVQVRLPLVSPKAIVIQDIWPTWNQSPALEEVIIFYTGRRPDGASVNIHSTGTATLAQANGKLVTLSTLPFIPVSPNISRHRKRIAYVKWGNNEAYIFDLSSGKFGRINDGTRTRRSMPYWDSEGTRIVMSGNHDHSSKVEAIDDDIFIAKISERLSINAAEYQYCIASLPGRDILPVFTTNDSWVVFAHQEKVEENGWSIYRVKPDREFNKKGYLNPEKLIDGIPEPERLSPFPDGKRILVSYTGNEYGIKNLPEIIDVEAKRSVVLKLPILLDPDLPLGKPLVPREISVSPDGEKIAFSALRWSGNPKDNGAILIYLCDIDGKNLRRITSPENVGLEIYNYPQEGITALNAWEKLQPKPNLGQPVNPFDIEVHRKQIEEWDKMEKEARDREAKKRAINK